MAQIPEGIRLIDSPFEAVNATMYPRKRFRETMPRIPEGKNVSTHRKARRSKVKLNQPAAFRLFVPSNGHSLVHAIGV